VRRTATLKTLCILEAFLGVREVVHRVPKYRHTVVLERLSFTRLEAA
jgi:hypothetical protein